MTHMYEKVKAIISKSPEERGIKEIQSLLPWFRKKSELFVSVKDGKKNVLLLNKFNDPSLPRLYFFLFYRGLAIFMILKKIIYFYIYAYIHSILV